MAEDLLAHNTDLINMAWAVIAAPFVTGVILILLRAFELRRSINTKEDYKLSEKFTGGLGVFGLLVSLVLSFIVTFQYFSEYVDLSDPHHPEITSVQGDFLFLPTQGGAFNWGILLGPLSVIMMLLLAIIAFVIHVYATEYMHDDSAYTRFFGTLNFFTGSMFGFVLASNLFMGFIFWELLGFASYLLIGYYWPKRSASSAGKKAFLYNKVGDVSFMIGIALIWALTANLGSPTLDYFALKQMVTAGTITISDVWLPGLLIFGGAVGKSAQLPLFGWLPEAMEGPTPVSALLHSSTMVKAGLYLTARVFFTFFNVHDFHVEFVSDAALAVNVIAWVGTFTALVGGLIALTATDIKKVLAFSTISQLGYIGLALGAGGLTASFFHLISHATFKSLLFLGAGAVIHSVHSQEMSDMGGLKKHMPIANITMLLGLLGLAGFPFFNGFWSKDAVLLALNESEVVGAQFLYIIAVVTAGITAFYSAKLYILTFRGEPKYDEEHVHPHKTSPMMAFALISLALLVVVESVWWSFGIGTGREDFWNFEYTLGSLLGVHGGEFEFLFAVPSTLLVLGGIGLAYLMYEKNGLTFLQESSIMAAFYKAAENRFGFDLLIYWIAEKPVMMVGDFFQYVDKEIIDGIIIDGVVAKGSVDVVAHGSDKFDRNVIDGFIDGLGEFVRDVGRSFRNLQNGQTPWYARLMIFGLALVLTAYTVIYTINPTIL